MKKSCFSVGCRSIAGQPRTTNEVTAAFRNCFFRLSTSFFAGILQKGDGSVKDLRHSKPRAIRAIGSAGKKRAAECKSSCEGSAASIDLLSVISMTSGPEGSVYVGDYNLIRRVFPDGRVKTVFKFASNQGSFHYDIKVSATDNYLYLSHAERRQIWRLRIPEDNEAKRNEDYDYEDEDVEIEIVAGTGERCLPGAKDACGNGLRATQARFDSPKGIALANDGTIYISDGRNIRTVNPDGIIDTLIGHHGTDNGPSKPLGCQNVFETNKLQLQWPTKLAIHPLDNTLYIVDDRMVLKLTSDMRVVVVAGQSPICSGNSSSTAGSLGALTDLAFAPDGDLFLAEKRAKPQKPRVRVIDQHGLNRPFFNIGDELAAVTVLANRSVFAADNKALSIYKIEPVSPEIDSESGGTWIRDPLAKEEYTFNRYGQHVTTRNFVTGKLVYKFDYSKNSAFGKLTSVTDALGNKVSFQRDFTGRIKSIENALGQKFAVGLTRLGRLESFEINGEQSASFSYTDSGLISSKRLSGLGNAYAFDYDDLGQLTRSLTSSGESLELESSLADRGDCAQKSEAATDAAICITAKRGGGIWRRFLVGGHHTTQRGSCNAKNSAKQREKKFRKLFGIFFSLFYPFFPFRRLWVGSCAHAGKTFILDGEKRIKCQVHSGLTTEMTKTFFG